MNTDLSAMRTDLDARYVYAVTRNLPPATQPEVARELDGLIADMLAERCPGREPADADIRAVLTELGQPDELAVKYTESTRTALISGVHYLMYKRVLRVVLPVAAAVVAMASVLSAMDNWSTGGVATGVAATIVGGGIAAAIDGVLQAFALITVGFALMEGRPSKRAGGDFVDNLPPVPARGAELRLHRPIIDMLWWIVLVVVFLGFPQIIGGWTSSTGWIPVFAVAVMRSLWLPIVGWAVIGIGKNVFRIVEAQYTTRLSVVTLAANIVMAALAAVVFLNPGIVNPDFVTHIGDFMEWQGTPVTFVGGPSIGLVAFSIIALVLAVDTITTVLRGLIRR